MDALLFTSLVKELASLLPGAKIQRIDQPSSGEVWLHMRKPGQNLRLVMTTAGDLASAYLSTRQKEQSMPAAPPSFCMLLRRRISGGKIESVSQPALERIFRIEIVAGDEFGNPVRWTLVAEIMGKRSNLILLDSDSRIAGVIRPVGESQNRFRQLLPGLQYVAPPPITKAHPRSVTPDDLLAADGGKSWAFVILSAVAGFSPKLAHEACYRAAVDPLAPANPDDADKVALACQRMWQEAAEAKMALVCSDPAGAPLWCHVLDLHGECSERLSFSSVSAALEHTSVAGTRQRDFESRYHSIKQSLNAQLDRVAKRLAAREEDLLAAANREELKQKADLILTYLDVAASALKAHQAEIALVDPATGNNVDINLDLSLDASGNVQRLYKRYAKAKATEKSLTPQVERDRAEVAYLSSVGTALDLARDVSDLQEIKTELEQQGSIEVRRNPAAAKKGKPDAVRQPEPDRFKTSAGEEVLLGRNNRQNDFLTFKIARPQDIWFHAKGFPGAHVVLRAKGGQATDKSLFEAATLAATHCAGRDATKVEVDYTQVKHVRKMPGGKPGMVIYENYRTIVAKPDPLMVNALRFSGL